MAPSYVLITGGNRGLGLELAKSLAMSGRNVLLTSRDSKAGHAAMQQVRDVAPGVDCHAVQLDTVSQQSIQALGEQVRQHWPGQIDTLVNNAGIYPDGWDRKTWEATRAVNLLGPVQLTQELLPALPDGARIVNVSSGLGQLSNCTPAFQRAITAASDISQLLAIGFDTDPSGPGSFKPTYCLSKAMLNRASDLFAQDAALHKRGITCCAADPGWCRTDMGGQSAPRSAQDGAASILAAVNRRDTNGGTWTDGRRWAQL